MHYKNFMPLAFLLLISFTNKSEQPDKKIIMAVFAHPDDEITVSPLLAKLAREGHTVYLVIATKGELGVAKHANIPAGDSLAHVRAGEANCACERLGIKPPVLLQLGDGSLAKDFTGKPLRNKLDSILSLYKPDIVITWGPDGGYGHMDHRLVHDVVTELFQSGAYAKPTQLYYTGFPVENQVQSIHFKTADMKQVMASWRLVKNKYLTTRIKCDKQDFAKAASALTCHQSQYAKDQMDDIGAIMFTSTRDTIYLRPFTYQQGISFALFQ